MNNISKYIFGILWLVLVFPSLSLVYADVSLTSDGKVPGGPFTYLQEQIDKLAIAVEEARLPPGTIIADTSVVVPVGYLVCNGQLVSRSDYPDLFAAIGTMFGDGDGITTFSVPDLRGEFIRGWDEGRGADPWLNRPLGTVQSDAFQNHKHDIIVEDNPSSVVSGIGYELQNAPIGSGAEPVVTSIYTDPVTVGEVSASVETPREISGGPPLKISIDETRPRNVALRFLIRY